MTALEVVREGFAVVDTDNDGNVIMDDGICPAGEVVMGDENTGRLKSETIDDCNVRQNSLMLLLEGVTIQAPSPSAVVEPLYFGAFIEVA